MKEKDVIAAIRLYEASPDKSAFPTETLRNIVNAAQQFGINWEPDFSLKRAGLSALDSLAMGLIPGDHAITKGERFASNIGSVGSFFAGGAAARGLGAGAKALKFAGGGASSRAASGFAKARQGAAQVAGRAVSGADEAMDLAKAAGKGGDYAKALKARTQAEIRLDKALNGLQKAEERTANLLDGIATRVNAGGGAARAVQGMANYGASGALQGAVQGAEDGDPLGGLLGGAIGGSLLGAVGGAAMSPAVMQAMGRHPLATLGAGTAGLTGLAFPAY